MSIIFNRCCFSVIAAVLCAVGSAGAQEPGSRWESAIAAFEAADVESPPKPGGIVFVGSSSIRMWDLAKHFPDRELVNRGFGGSEIADSTAFAQRILVPHHPQQIVLYAGDNDIARGKNAEALSKDFEQFVHTISESLPQTKIAFLAIKPSIRRWELWPTIKQANDAIETRCRHDPKLDFIDITEDMLNDQGMPNPALFAADGLHLSDAGYALWTARIRGALGW